MSLADSVRSNLGPTFADDLRTRSDDELAELFRLRPDLINPIPADLTTLASRATSAPSLIRAIESLNQWQLQVLEATSLFEDSFTANEAVELTRKEAALVITELVTLGLLYKDGKKFRIPRAVRDILGEYVAGLGPSIAQEIDFKAIKKAPDGAVELLERLMWGPPRGEVGDIHKKGGVIEWLLKNRFLIPIDSKTVALPREVALHLRCGKLHEDYSTSEPKLEGKSVTASESDRAAVASISSLLRLVSELLNFWAEETPTALQSGGLGVRDLKKASEHLGVEEVFTAFIAELALQVGILNIEADGRILPNANFDIFQTKSFEGQWRDLVSSWHVTSRVSGLIGRLESRNVTALGSELDRANAARIRNIILKTLVPSISPTIESLTSAARWHYPHRRALAINTETVSWTAREAEWLGITGAGALSTFGKKYLSGEKRLGIDAALPAPVDHILIQGDNTAIAPGPLTVEISRHLSTFADIESRGGATVYRFSEGSLRRGLDHGHTGEEIRAFLRDISKTPVPQPLDYLISDVAKKHGRLRVGYANCYIRCDDETVIAAILKDRNLEHLRLRQIAPQVLVGDAESSDMMDELRSAGYFPSGENGQGAVIQVPVAHRAKSKPKPPRIVGEISAPSDDILKVAIRTLRTGEKSAPKRTTGELPRTSSSETLDLLNEYLGKGVALRIG
ncbi:MAG: helicase-associated domain-containing protein, partial [Actinomycetota bacterium]